MLFNNNVFDLIISIGCDCACSTYLRKFNLQNESYPFDWLTAAPLKIRIDLIVNNFDTFLIKENMKYLPRLHNPKVYDSRCDEYEDLETKFKFFHDFPTGMNYDEAYTIVKNRYQRRIQRFYKKIEKSKKILFVWFGRSEDEDPTNEDLIEYKTMLDKKFPNKNIYILALKNKTGQKKFIEEHIQPEIIRVSYDTLTYDTLFPEKECVGNVALNDKLFAKLSLKVSKEEKIKKIMYNFLIKYPSFIIINKQKRRIFRENLRQKIFKN